MTAEPVPHPARPPVPEWLRPPPKGFTADDLDRLPDLPPHTELIDGSLVLVSPQSQFHTTVLDLLTQGLRRTAPERFRVRREMTVVLGHRQRPEPDLLVVQADAAAKAEQTFYRPEDVALAVEVVSPESLIRDRERKPQLYARAGIEHFWRVELVSGKPTVYVFQLEPAAGIYATTGIYQDRLRVDLPFGIDIDLNEIDRL